MGQHRADRYLAAGERFGEQHHVGLDAPVLACEKPARATKPRLDFIGDEQGSVFSAEFQRSLQIAIVRKDDALSLKRLDEESGTILGYVAMPGASRLCSGAEHAQHPTQHRLRQFRRLHEQGTGPGDRRNLRRKFRAAEKASVIEMTVVDDVTPIVKDIYPLYLKVYERSKLQFEKLTSVTFTAWVS